MPTAVFLDQQSIEAPLEARTVDEVVGIVRRNLADRRRMIVGLRVDGQAVDADGVFESLARPLADVRRIDLESQEVRPLVLGILRELRAQLEPLHVLRGRIADSLAGGQGGTAMPELGDFVRMLGQVHQGLLMCLETMRINGAAVDGPALDVGAHVQPLTNSLRQLHDALMARDEVLLADCMRYEFESALDQWRAVLTEVIDAVQSEPRL